MAKYSLTEEHRDQLKPWAEKWIANAMSCEPMGDADREATHKAVLGLHAAANLEAPRAVVFVASPFTAAIAAGVASGVWYLREHPEKHQALFGRKLAERDLMAAIGPACAFAVSVARHQVAKLEAPPAPKRSATDAATRAATDAATSAATYAATRAATDAATYDATRAATDAATRAATSAATDDATRAATDAATSAATDDATDAATDDATRAATDDATRAATDAATSAADLVRFLVRCSEHSWRLRNGGNQWSAWCSYLSFFRHVAKLPIDYSKWAHYEAAAIHAGPRYMHQKFTIVSDRPAVCKKDELNRPHCADGPSHLWRDGYALYFWRGTRVPADWIERRDSLDAKTALTWPNIEQRRAAAEIIGWARVLEAVDAKVVQKDRNPQIGTLLRADLPDAPGQQFLQVQCGTGRSFVLPVPPDVKSAREANAWTYGLSAKELRLEVRT